VAPARGWSWSERAAVTDKTPKRRRAVILGAVSLALLGGAGWWVLVGSGEGPPVQHAPPVSGATARPAASAPLPALEGQVVDRERGHGLSDASVSVRCGEGEARRIEADSEGRFAVDALPPGACEINASATGYSRGGPTTGAARAIEIADGVTARVTLEMSETATVSGRIEGGTGAPDEVELSVLYIEAGGEAESFHIEMDAHPDGSGGFELRGLLPGELQILAEPPEDGIGESEVLVLAPGAARRGVLIRLGSTAELTGRVSASDDGLPVAGATVRVYAQGASAAARVESESDGRFSLQRLAPGAALVTITARGFVARTNLPVELLAGEASALSVELERAPGFAGQVLGPDGQPVVGASIFVQSATDAPQGASGRRVATTRAEGRFSVERNLVWPVFVQASHDELGASPWTRIESAGEDVTLRLGGGSGLVGRVVDSRGQAVDGVRVSALASGRARYAGAGEGEGGSADPRDGRFHIAVGRPGTWSVVAGAPGFAPTESARFEVPAGRIIDVGTLVLRPGARIVGLVVDAATREPLAGARVSAQGSDARGPTGEGGGGITGPDGRFSIDRLPPRRMSVHVSAEGHRMRLLTGLEPRPGEVTDVGTVMLSGDEGRRGGMDYGGIGASLRIQGDSITLSGVFKGSAAEAAGLTKGTRIMSIDGRDAASMGLQEALELLRGEPETDVNVEVMRPDSPSVETVRLVRREVSAH
jgi:hypothetical protein